MRKKHYVWLAVLATALPWAAPAADLEDRVQHGYADSQGVKIHYALLGQGPLIVMLHGFPDYWYTWRDQMQALSKDYRVAAVDLRGYNLSDKPQGVDQYAMGLLMGDVAAVIRHLGEEKAIVVGHDWGGAIAWQFAMNLPQMVDRLIILNLPHPRGIFRELANNPEQNKNSQYARDFQQEGAHKNLTAEGLAGWVKDPAARAKYIEAFRRSDFEAMLNYYKRNFPRSSGSAAGSGAAATAAPAMPNVKVPVLMFHGLEDKALMHQALNGTWEWLDKDLTLVTIPGAGHFVQQDASEMVTRMMKAWLSR